MNVDSVANISIDQIIPKLSNYCRWTFHKTATKEDNIFAERTITNSIFKFIFGCSTCLPIVSCTLQCGEWIGERRPWRCVRWNSYWRLLKQLIHFFHANKKQKQLTRTRQFRLLFAQKKWKWNSFCEAFRSTRLLLSRLRRAISKYCKCYAKQMELKRLLNIIYWN